MCSTSRQEYPSTTHSPPIWLPLPCPLAEAQSGGHLTCPPQDTPESPSYFGSPALFLILMNSKVLERLVESLQQWFRHVSLFQVIHLHIGHLYHLDHVCFLILVSLGTAFANKAADVVVGAVQLDEVGDENIENVAPTMTMPIYMPARQSTW